MPRKIRLLLGLLLVLNCGCASDQHDDEVDQLWRQGYGFNNPNPERIKSGDPPLNFDGSVYDRD